MRTDCRAIALLLIGAFIFPALRAEAPRDSPLTGLPPGAIALPSRIFPGDRLDIWLPLEGDGPKTPPLLEGDLELLAFDDGKEGGAMLHLALRAWNPGSYELPSFSAGGPPCGPFGLRVESALARHGRELRPQRRALLFPGTGAALAVLLSSLAALALLAWGFAAIILPRLRRFLRIRAGRKPVERLKRDCALLARRAGSAEPGSFYADLSRAFRTWAAARAHPAFAALSAAEMGALGSEGGDPSFAALAAAAGPLARADLARFAGEAFGVDRLRADVQELLDIALRTEAARDEP